MRAALCYAAVLYHQYLLRAADHRKPVRDHHRRPADHQPFHRSLDERLAFRLDRGGRLVQQQYPRIGQEGPGEADSLLLPADRE